MPEIKRIAMFGGSFNPVHNAHILLSQRAVREIGIDKVLIVPTFFTPLKDNGAMASAEDRLNMCRLAFESVETAYVDDVEIRRGGKSYTADTLEFFHGRFEKAGLYLIVGADMFMTLQKWHKAEEIFKLAKIITVPRDENHLRQLKTQEKYLESLGADCILLKEPIMTLSSTEIRNKIRTGADITGLMPESVISYIRTNNLYVE